MQIENCKVQIARFRAFLAERGHVAACSDNVLWLALRLAERLRGDGTFYGNQHTGSLGKAKLAPNGGGGTGAGNGNDGLKQVTKEEAREFHKKSGESRQDHYVRVGGVVKTHLDEAGLPVKEPLPAAKTSSVYLKGKQFDVRISDGHDAKPKKQTTLPAKPEYQLAIPGSGISAAKVNKLLSEIVAKHKK